jgi:hypothetical protein
LFRVPAADHNRTEAHPVEIELDSIPHFRLKILDAAIHAKKRLCQQLPLKVNTVYLRVADEGPVLDDGSIPVVGVFDLVDGHLSFDHAWVGTGASIGQEFVEDLGGDASVGVVEGVRGKNPGGWRWCAERPGASG